MLKTEGVYDEFCYSEVTIATALNHTYLSSQLDGHLNDRNTSLISAKLNATLQSLPDYPTELPSFNTTYPDDYENAEEGDRDAKEENVTTTERPADDEEDKFNGRVNREEEKDSDKTNGEEDETTTTESSEAVGRDNGESDDSPSDDSSESATGVNSESINRIKNVPSITTTPAAPVRRKRDASKASDSDPGKNGPTSQVTFPFLFEINLDVKNSRCQTLPSTNALNFQPLDWQRIG